jgi:hypothetical protein
LFFILALFEVFVASLFFFWFYFFHFSFVFVGVLSFVCVWSYGRGHEQQQGEERDKGEEQHKEQLEEVSLLQPNPCKHVMLVEVRCHHCELSIAAKVCYLHHDFSISLFNFFCFYLLLLFFWASFCFCFQFF